MSSVEEVMNKYEICYAYNETFHAYHEEEMTREECEKFVLAKIQCKGGHWVVRKKGEYQESFDAYMEIKRTWSTDDNCRCRR